MKKCFFALILGMLTSFGACTKSADTKTAQIYMTEMVVTTSDVGPVTIVSYVSGKDARMETYRGEGNEKTLALFTILKDGFAYQFSPDQKSGIKRPLNSPGNQQTASDTLPQAAWSHVKKDAKSKGLGVSKQGSQFWEGREYEVGRVTNLNKAHVDYYLDKNGIVKRFVYYDPAGRQQQEMKVVKYEVLDVLPAGTLDVPSDYKIIDMSQMKAPGIGDIDKP